MIARRTLHEFRFRQREQNLDATGWIKVHEQGTATVTGTVSVANFPSSVAVSNFPETQNVNVTGGEVSTKPSPVTTGFSDNMCAAAGEQTRVRLDFTTDGCVLRVRSA